ncbi:ABC transporter permease [bacterium]|nr:ABC transporter permease [bacterium]
MKRMLAIARKEFVHILRDPRSLAFAILMPLMMVLLYGYAIDMDLRNLRVGILDYDRSRESADFVSRMTSGKFIVASEYLNSREDIEQGFRKGQFYAALVFPEGYGRRLVEAPASPIQILVDGADGTTAATVGSYLEAVSAQLNRDQMRAVIGERSQPIEIKSRVWFNPELISARFIVPGLVAIVLMMICSLLTSVAIVREKETGTLEQVLTTPVSAAQVVVGKVLPYMLIGVLDAALILAVGRHVFGVPMNGSWSVLAGYSFVYLSIAVSFGLLISTIAKTQQVAMMLAQLVTVIPTMLLSGFVFPVSSMPKILQGVAHIFPAYYYQRIIRGVMMKGQSSFPFEGGVMIAMAVFILVITAKRFHMRLDK